MIKVFLDTDVILDLLLKRKPFHYSAYKIFTSIENRRITGYTSPLVIAKLHYILTKLLKKEKSIEIIKDLLQILKLTTIDEEIILKIFLHKKIKDFEDLIQYYSAKEFFIEYLITRNIKDYPESTNDIKIISSEKFVSLFLSGC